MNFDARKFERLDRRTALKWLAMAAGAAVLGPRLAATETQSPSAAVPSGYGPDPDLQKSYAPGELWPLTFTPAQHQTAAALCEMILPSDERSPSAAALKVQDFIDEWVSAPYASCQDDRARILNGLGWIEAESRRRLGRGFHDLDNPGRKAICDLVCDAASAPADLAEPARFFARFRDLTVAGFYTTPEGMKDLQFMGDTPSASFAGPSKEVLARLGIL